VPTHAPRQPPHKGGIGHVQGHPAAPLAQVVDAVHGVVVDDPGSGSVGLDDHLEVLLPWREQRLGDIAGLRLGEIRALTRADVDLEAGALNVRRSLLPDGAAKAPRTEAGKRTAAIIPALRRVLVAWRLRSPHTRPGDPVVCTARAAAPSRSGTFAARSMMQRRRRS